MLLAPEVRVLQVDLDFIRHPDPCSESPYLGVVRHRGWWRARAFKQQVGEVQPTARAAAVLLIGWWKAQYGERWREYWAFRQAAGWKVDRCRRTGRCDVRVWLAAVGGESEQVLWLVSGRKKRFALTSTRPLSPAFDGSHSARLAFRRWVRSTFGLYAAASQVVIRRSSSPSHRLGRMTPVPHERAG